MGWLEGAGIGGVAGGIYGNMIGAVAGSQSGFGGTSQSAPQVDPRVKEIRDAQLKRAKDYRANMAGMKQEQTSQAAEGSRQDLAGRLANVTSHMNNRGLLYSGLNQQARIGAQQESASDLAAKTANINTQVEDQANNLDSQALGTSFAAQQQQQGLNDSTFQSNMARANMRQQYVNNIAGAYGKGVGMMMGAG